jgi:hypothetical protein
MSVRLRLFLGVYRIIWQIQHNKVNLRSVGLDFTINPNTVHVQVIHSEGDPINFGNAAIWLLWDGFSKQNIMRLEPVANLSSI